MQFLQAVAGENWDTCILRVYIRISFWSRVSTHVVSTWFASHCLHMPSTKLNSKLNGLVNLVNDT